MVSETKLLGTVITDKLTLDRNTEELVKKGYRRMQLLNAAAGYTSAKNDLKDIYEGGPVGVQLFVDSTTFLLLGLQSTTKMSLKSTSTTKILKIN